MAIAIVAGQGGGSPAIELSDCAIGDAKNRGMHEGRVITVAFILEDEFPVGLDAMLEKTRGDLDFAFGRGADQPIDGLGGAAKMLFEGWAVGGKGAEHKPAVG